MVFSKCRSWRWAGGSRCFRTIGGRSFARLVPNGAGSWRRTFANVRLEHGNPSRSPLKCLEYQVCQRPRRPMSPSRHAWTRSKRYVYALDPIQVQVAKLQAVIDRAEKHVDVKRRRSQEGGSTHGRVAATRETNDAGRRLGETIWTVGTKVSAFDQHDWVSSWQTRGWCDANQRWTSTCLPTTAGQECEVMKSTVLDLHASHVRFLRDVQELVSRISAVVLGQAALQSLQQQDRSCSRRRTISQLWTQPIRPVSSTRTR